MPAVSPVVLTVTVNLADHDAATLQSSARCLSRAARKSLQLRTRCLSPLISWPGGSRSKVQWEVLILVLWGRFQTLLSSLVAMYRFSRPLSWGPMAGSKWTGLSVWVGLCSRGE